MNGTKFLWDVKKKGRYHTMESLLPALSESFSLYEAFIDRERQLVHEHNAKILAGELPDNVKAKTAPKLHKRSFGKFFRKDNILQHYRFFDLVKDWWPNRDSRADEFVWKAVATAEPSDAAPASAPSGNDLAGYAAAYKYYIDKAVQTNQLPNSPKAQAVYHNYAKGAFAGAKCFFGDRAVPLSIQSPDTNSVVYSPSGRSLSMPPETTADEVADVEESGRGLRLSNASDLSSPVRRVRLSDVTQGTDSSYEDSSDEDVSFSDDWTEADLEFLEKVVWIKYFIEYKASDDGDIHVLGLDATRNVPVTLTLSKKTYTDASRVLTRYKEGEDNVDEDIDDDADVACPS